MEKTIQLFGDGRSRNSSILGSAAPRMTMSLAEQVALQVSEAIVQEELAPGQAITEQSLSENFGVSRGPVREALRILEREGLVEIVPRQGARVTHLTIEEVNQVFELRAVLLGFCAARAARTQNEDCLVVLREGCARLEENLNSENSLSVHAEVSARMNEAMVTTSKNERIDQIVFQLARQTARYTRLGLSSSSSRQRSVKTWNELIGLISDGKEREAEMLERRRVLDVRKYASHRIEEAD
jgi:DNA-binding GntR family transcriptional regulator